MAVSIGVGIGGVGIMTGYGKGGSASDNIRNKITELERQLEKLEQQREKKKSDDIDRKIDGLKKRIANLESRLDSLGANSDKVKSGKGKEECETCENRRYQDGSDDPGVSFKSATKVSPEAAASAVRGHEMEHVYRNQAKAEREDREVVSQSVVIKSGICPECGKPYVAGGETRTVTRAKQDNRFAVGLEDKTKKGEAFNAVA